MLCDEKTAILLDMEIIEQLEFRLEELIQRKRELEQENARLRSELDEARQGRDDVLAKVNGLLQRVQEEML